MYSFVVCFLYFWCFSEGISKTAELWNFTKNYQDKPAWIKALRVFLYCSNDSTRIPDNKPLFYKGSKKVPAKVPALQKTPIFRTYHTTTQYKHIQSIALQKNTTHYKRYLLHYVSSTTTDYITLQKGIQRNGTDYNSYTQSKHRAPANHSRYGTEGGNSSVIHHSQIDKNGAQCRR